MKKLLIICAIVAGAWSSKAQNVENFNFRRVDKTTVPVEVTGAAERDFRNGRVREYFAVPAEFSEEDWMVNSNENSTDEKPDYYSVSVEENGNTYYALYTKSGKRISTQTNINNVKLPENIVKDIHKKYPGYKIESDKYTRLVNESDRRVYYRVTIQKDETVKHLFYSEHGKAVK